MAWQDTFPEPIPLQQGGVLVTLKDGGQYLKTVCGTFPDAQLLALAAEALIRASSSGRDEDLQAASEAVLRVVAQSAP
jgi:hypothetical protein